VRISLGFIDVINGKVIKALLKALYRIEHLSKATNRRNGGVGGSVKIWRFFILSRQHEATLLLG
jgi:hypothetical protein